MRTSLTLLGICILYPDIKDYSYRCNSDKTQKARLNYALVSPNLIDQISQVEHCITNASDHATISIEISTDIEKQGQCIFRAPPYIQNNPKYVKLADEVLQQGIDALCCRQSECNTSKKYAGAFLL